MPPIFLLIKPVSLSCNMRCEYCFGMDIAANRAGASCGVMSLGALEQIVSKALSAASRQCTFAFQGGEPTLAGLDFFKSLTELVARHNTKRLDVNYAIQTNGYCIDREWAAFFAEHRFLVGLSLDGVKDIHDLYRKDNGGKGTFSRVMRASQLFNHHNVEYNILTVVTAQTAKNIGKIYSFFSRNNFAYQQYIPCLDAIGAARGQREYSLTPKLYGDFLCALFDLWHNDFIRGKRVSIRFFDNIMQMMAGVAPESCAMAGRCVCQNVVDADGSVYPCDFYTLDEYRLGNIRDDDFATLGASQKASDFMEASLPKSPQCGECQWYPLCRGGCRRDCEPEPNTGSPHNYYCAAYKRFFEHAYIRLKECAARLN